MSNFDDHGEFVSFRTVVLPRLPVNAVGGDDATRDALFDAIEVVRETEIRRVDSSIRVQDITHERLLRPGAALEPNNLIFGVLIDTTVPVRFNRNDDDDWLIELGEIEATAMRSVLAARMGAVRDSDIVWSSSTRPDETETARKARR